MTFASLKSTGSGSLRYRLMIEGWPDEFVTDSAITATTGLDGRTVRPGLLYRGLQISDRVIMQEARIEADGITFRIRPTQGRVTSTSQTDPITTSLSLYPEPVAALAADLAVGATTMSITGGGSLSNDTVYHIGTETIRVGTWPNITRGVWDTVALQNRVSVWDRSRAVYIYANPPTMEGRRAYLYVYGAGDSLTGTGTVIWRGIVSRPPRLEDDCMTWQINCQPITHVLKQTVAGELKDAHPSGIYHHAAGAVWFKIFYDGAWGNDVTYAGYDPSESQFLDDINGELATALAALGASTTIDFLRLIRTTHGFSLHVRTAGGTPVSFALEIGSPIIGYVSPGGNASPLWIDNAGNRKLGDHSGSYLAAHTDYYAPLSHFNSNAHTADVGYVYDGAPVNPLGYASQALFQNPLFFQDSSAVSTSPSWRIYTDTSIGGASAVQISGSLNGAADGIYEVDASTDTYIDLKPATVNPRRPRHLTVGFLTRETTIKVIRNYATFGNITDFRDAVVSASTQANDGDTPFVTSNDLATWTLGDTAAIIPEVAYRAWQYTRQVALDKIFQEDLKLAAHFMRIDSSGKIGIAPIPSFTESTPVAATHQIDSSTIITPAGSFGSWPKVDPQRDGIITTISLQQHYNPYTGEWDDTPLVFQDPDAIATHKNRGKGELGVKPYSRPALITGLPTFPEITIGHVAARYLGFFSRDYLVVTVEVPFKHFDVLCGDVVSFTHKLVPDGSGNRGMTARRGVVIARRWNLDPGSGEEMGTLTIWIPARPVYGYSPSAVITGQSNTGGNTWNLTCSTANTINVALSTNADGQCLEHFAASDYISIVQRNAASPTIVTGRISGTPDAAAGTCTVNLDGVWTPGTSAWVLEFQKDDTGGKAQEGQRKFAYVANDSLTLPDGAFARRLL
jgi:hypothetical protein